MIVLLSEARPGFVRGVLSTQTLRRVLCGELSLEDALTDGGTKQLRSVHYSQIEPGALVGFLAYPAQPREIIVARLPFTQQMVPAVTLRPTAGDWEPAPQLISKNYLLRHEAVALRADWLSHLVNVAGTLEHPTVRAFGVDKSLLAIGAVWERWECTPMTWPQRCEDLARLTGLKKLKPNTLLNKCKRLGLIRSDNKTRSASRDKQELVA